MTRRDDIWAELQQHITFLEANPPETFSARLTQQQLRERVGELEGEMNAIDAAGAA